MESDLTGFFEHYRNVRAQQALLADIRNRLEQAVAALDDLTAAFNNLQQIVNDAVTAIGAQGLTTDEAETFVTDLNNLASSLQAALGGTPPPA